MMVSGDVVGTLPCFKRTSIQKRRISKQQEKIIWFLCFICKLSEVNMFWCWLQLIATAELKHQLLKTIFIEMLDCLQKICLENIFNKNDEIQKSEFFDFSFKNFTFTRFPQSYFCLVQNRINTEIFWESLLIEHFSKLLF